MMDPCRAISTQKLARQINYEYLVNTSYTLNCSGKITLIGIKNISEH